MSVLMPRNLNKQTSRFISSWLPERLPSCLLHSLRVWICSHQKSVFSERPVQSCTLDMVCYGHTMREAWRMPCAAVCLLAAPHLPGTPHYSHLQLTIIISEMSFKKMSRVIRNKSEFWNASSRPPQRRHILSKESLKKTLKRTVLIFISVYIYFQWMWRRLSIYIHMCVYVCLYATCSLSLLLSIYISKSTYWSISMWTFEKEQSWGY